METENDITHYHANMAALLQVGKWLDTLRENGVYDNTRIIIVSDHSRNIFQQEDLVLNASYSAQSYFPLMMVKDFSATQFTQSDEFMTNADMPTLVMQDLIENPVNPFTEKLIDSSEKMAHKQYVILSTIWQTTENNGNSFLPSA